MVMFSAYLSNIARPGKQSEGLCEWLTLSKKESEA